MDEEEARMKRFGDELNGTSDDDMMMDGGQVTLPTGRADSTQGHARKRSTFGQHS